MTQPWIVDRRSTPAELHATLMRHGVAIVPNALEPGNLALLNAELAPHFARSAVSKGLFYGETTKRFGGVLARSREAQALALNPLALGAAHAVLHEACQGLQLNLTQAIEIGPDSFAQVPHRDQDIWQGAPHQFELMVNAMWALDDFTADNGATLLWPGSHKSVEIDMPASPGVPAVMPAGSLCLFLGSTLHSGGANWTSRGRRGLVISYCQGWLKPCENPWLTYPPEIARMFDAELAALVGYRQDPPSLNNVNGRCPSELLWPGGEPEAFADQLTDEQTALIRQFNSLQSAGLSKVA